MSFFIDGVADQSPAKGGVGRVPGKAPTVGDPSCRFRVCRAGAVKWHVAIPEISLDVSNLLLRGLWWLLRVVPVSPSERGLYEVSVTGKIAECGVEFDRLRALTERWPAKFSSFRYCLE